MAEKIIFKPISDKERQELEELVNLLGNIRGSHTELVTVLIPAGTNIHQVSNQLAAEAGTAENIKSKATRTAVVSALETIIRELKNHKQTPPNGLAIFCGNVSEKEGVVDIKLWAYEPPRPLNVRLYRCDKTFLIDPLKEILDVSEVYGLLVMDRREATIGLLEGKQIKVLRTLSSGVPGKIRAGGQCLAPDTLIMMADKKTKRISDLKKGEEVISMIDNHKYGKSRIVDIWENEKNDVIVITTKDNKKITCSKDHLLYARKKKIDCLDWFAAEELSEGDELSVALIEVEETEASVISNFEIINKPIKLFDISTEKKNFIANGLIVHNSAQRFERLTEGFAKEFFKRVADAMKEIFFDMPKLKGILIGGPIPTKEEFLEQGELVTKLKNKVITIKDLGYTDEHGLKLLVEASEEDLAEQELVKEKAIINKFFETLGKKREKAAYGMDKTLVALEKGAVEMLLISKKLPKEQTIDLEKKAQNIGASVFIISTENQEGKQFLNLTKGVGAILRFQIE